jgi:hypothetical protein
MRNIENFWEYGWHDGAFTARRMRGWEGRLQFTGLHPDTGKRVHLNPDLLEALPGHDRANNQITLPDGSVIKDLGFKGGSLRH